MIKSVVSVLLVVALALSSGCSLFRKSRGPKESTAIAGEVEETFRIRWVEKRSSQLVSQGVAAPAAKTQAEQEFRERYQFDRKPGK